MEDRYSIASSVLHPEVSLDDDRYSTKIILYIKPTNEEIPVFTKELEIISSNSQTGFEVDEQREQAIQDYLTQINQ